MTLAEIAPIADLLAALGVMVTVAFVAYEMRQTRKQSELSNWRELLQTMIDYKAQMQDPDFAAFIIRAERDYEGLSEVDQMRFGYYLEQGVHIYGNFLKHNDSLPRKLQGLDDAVANLIIDTLSSPGGVAWWAHTRSRGRFMPATYQTIDQILAEGRKQTDI